MAGRARPPLFAMVPVYVVSMSLTCCNGSSSRQVAAARPLTYIPSLVLTTGKCRVPCITYAAVSGEDPSFRSRCKHQRPPLDFARGDALPRCGAPWTRVRRCLAAWRHAMDARASAPCRIAARHGRTCVGALPHCGTPWLHVRRRLAALRHAMAARASTPCRIAARHGRTCVGALPRCGTPRAHCYNLARGRNLPASSFVTLSRSR